MNFRDLPASGIVGRDYRKEGLSVLLEKIIGDTFFTHFEPIDGFGISGRILFVEEQPGAVSCKRPMTADIAAQELDTLRKQARYSPESRADAFKGWQVRATTVRGKPATIVLAEWIAHD